MARGGALRYAAAFAGGSHMLNRFLADESGATAIEYGLIAALISVVIISGLTILGQSINEKFAQVGSTIQAAGGGS
jgi:pilus assembly protein Flp/PilA